MKLKNIDKVQEGNVVVSESGLVLGLKVTRNSHGILNNKENYNYSAIECGNGIIMILDSVYDLGDL